MDRQDLLILENAAIERASWKLRDLTQALNYQKEKLTIAERTIDFSFGFWGMLTGKWDAAQNQAEMCDDSIDMLKKEINKIEENTESQIDYIYRNDQDKKPIEAVNWDTLET